MSTEKESAILQIRRNIEQFGHHVYVVQQATIPRFSYSIGLSSITGFEVFVAGAVVYMADEVVRIVNAVVSALRGKPDLRSLHIEDLGSFELRPAHDSWSEALLLGARDYYQQPHIAALQIVPDQEHITIDVPDCSLPWTETSEPVWQWLHLDWPYRVPPESAATTDLNALRGRPILEAARWEEGQWELFSGPGDEFPPDQVRVVPLATLLAFDASLTPVVELDVGGGLTRDSSSTEWNEW